MDGHFGCSSGLIYTDWSQIRTTSAPAPAPLPSHFDACHVMPTNQTIAIGSLLNQSESGGAAISLAQKDRLLPDWLLPNWTKDKNYF
mmetsp:Transcript_46224/g.77001  ORF Transcript_46224/g.77001 Transcript_46224/m.77001 type:complete len:87 (-) Transcript_46224:1053-1313(-)